MMSKLFLSLTSVFFLSSSLSATDIEPAVVDGDEVQVFQPLQSRRSFRANDHAYVLKVENLVSTKNAEEDEESDFLKRLKSFQLQNYGTHDQYWTALLVEVREGLRHESWPLEETVEHSTIEVGSSVRILMSDALKIGDRISCKELVAFSTPSDNGKTRETIYFAKNPHPIINPAMQK